MIISAGIISKAAAIFLADFLPQEVKVAVSRHANNFLYALGIDDDDIELPYLETSQLRYIYKQTGDLYWLLVTKPDSDIDSDVDLMGRFVCTIMEYGASETNSCTLTDEQKNLFYRHIWRPWDEYPSCPTCNSTNNQSCSWDFEFDKRLDFLRQLRDGQLNEEDVQYFNGIIAESWSISSKLSQTAGSRRNLEAGYVSESDSFCSSESDSINEETLIDRCRLVCRLEDIRLTSNRLQNNYLRLFARRDLLTQSEFNPHSQACSAPSIGDMDITCQP